MRVVATRLHTSNEAVPIDPEQIKAWCQNVLSYSDLLIIVVDNRYFQRVGKMLMRFGNRVKLFHIHPWIGYTQPLNMIIEKALSVGATKLLFQSIEVTALPEDIKSLERHLDSNTLVVGAKLHEMHGHVNEKVELTGWTTPWNTLALWNLEKLGLKSTFRCRLSNNVFYNFVCLAFAKVKSVAEILCVVFLNVCHLNFSLRVTERIPVNGRLAFAID